MSDNNTENLNTETTQEESTNDSQSMNIIERMGDILNNAPNITSFTNKVHHDFTANKPGDNFGLYSVGDAIVTKDILGNEVRRHNFILYAHNQAYTDYDRLVNSGFLLELSYYLESITEASGYDVEVKLGETTKSGRLTEVSCANAMLYQVPTGNINDGVEYQVQLYATYKVNN